ncbi:hypothetical protein QRD89_01835 [Halobacillus sp. ACCC02827]|uniref:hypothetical protein n=1 Tax=Bacillaceae TaxID=186817 RepID=UPI0002A4FAA6|nr:MULTISPECIES: hypothetical protein [Bacillaceae]ELK48716.1 hypothetical protein D479_02012 [Halobacillus sp. BAB-2008]QHT45347.1 hypothetical protein M662_01950 [Bacillus sp. SB49]WJE16130.1 hypothetical protein QRD89_01835 [Halobacillus sp. ACCC02827]
MVDLKADGRVFLYLSVLIAGYALFSIGDTAGNFFDQFLYYAGYIAMILFSFALIILGLSRLFRQFR